MAGGLRAARREAVASRAMLTVTVTARLVGLGRPSPSFVRIHLAGDELAAYGDARPADAFRLVLGPGAGAVPVTRALTVSAPAEPVDGELTLDVLDHAGGLLGPWLAAVAPGDEVSLLGLRTEFVARDLLRATAYWWAGSTGDEYDEVARAAWERARDRGLHTDDPIVVDEVLTEGVQA